MSNKKECHKNKDENKNNVCRYLFGKLIKKRGSVTVEASLIFPCIFLSVIGVIYVGILLYQQTLLKSISDECASWGAYYWSDYNKYKAGRDIRNVDVYLNGIDNAEEDRLKTIREHVERVIGDKNNQKIIVDFESDLTNKKIYILVKKEYPIPLAVLLKPFGLKDKFVITTKACTVINDQSEFIRKIDFLFDL